MAIEELIIRWFEASWGGNLVEIQRILDTYGNDLIETGHAYGNTSLMIACNFGHLEIVKLLLKKGASRYGGPAQRSGAPQACKCGKDR